MLSDRRIRAVFAACALLLVASADAVERRIRLATLAPKGTSYYQILLEMGEKWRQAPDGGVSLVIYPDGVMGGEDAMVRRMRVGQIQAALVTSVGLAEIDDSITAIQSMPMVFRSLDELDYVTGKMAPLLEKRFLDKGFVILFWADSGWIRFFAKRPALHPGDFQKLKVFTWAGNSKQVDIMKAAGYHPVPLEPADILTGLQTGLIDAVPSTPFYALAGQFYSPAPHMLEVEWAPLVGAAVITKAAWDALPPKTREALAAAAAEAGRKVKERGRAENEESVESMKKRGLTVHPFTPELAAEWRKVAEDVYPKIRGTMVPPELFDKVQELLREYRAEKKP